MGSYQTLYLGCYVEWDTVFREEISTTLIYEKCQAAYSRSQNFCSGCGGKVIEEEDPYTYPEDALSLLEGTEYFETLFGGEFLKSAKGRTIAIPNRGKHNFAEDLNGNTKEITPEIILQATLHFKEEFVNVLAFLETKVKNLEVKFGFIEYWY